MTTDNWTTGYAQSQLDAAQETFGLVFPPDLVALLRERRPMKGHDWNDAVAIRGMLDWPFESLALDIECNGLWWPEWGEQPASLDECKEVLRSVLAHAPKLIPLFSHRFLPEQPGEAGNPVFSVYGADTICYGSDLADYFEREFGGSPYVPGPHDVRYIPFWTELVVRNG